MSRTHQAKWRRVQGTSVTVPCAPLRELMVEAHFSKVTFLSLDVEGAELDISALTSPSGPPPSIFHHSRGDLAL